MQTPESSQPASSRGAAVNRADGVADPARRRLLEALGAATGLALPCAAPAQDLFGRRPRPLPPQQSIFRLRGPVTVDGRPATVETPIQPGQTVETGPGGEVVFVVGTHAMLLRERSRLVIEPAAPSSGSFVLRGLRILTGKILTVSRNVPLRVRTSSAIIGIRGTGWYAEADPDQTYFCTCYGTTDVTAVDDPASRDTVRSKQHDRPLYILRAGPQGQRIRNAPFINHTDQELALIEALVGRAPPYVFPKDAYAAPRREY